MLQFNYVRKELTEALLAYSKPGRNQIVTMSERACQANDHLCQPTRQIEIGNLSISGDAEPVQCTEGRPYRNSSVPVSPSIFRQIAWRRALHVLPRPYQAWLQYCYGDSTSFTHQVDISRHIWEAFLVCIKSGEGKRFNAATQERIKKLVLLSVQETKHLTNRGEPRYTAAELASLCGVESGNWRENYQPRWVLLKTICEQIDREALIYVEQLRKTARRNRNRNPAMPVSSCDEATGNSTKNATYQGNK